MGKSTALTWQGCLVRVQVGVRNARSAMGRLLCFHRSEAGSSPARATIPVLFDGRRGEAVVRTIRLLDVDGVLNADRPGWSAAPGRATVYADTAYPLRWAPALLRRIRRVIFGRTFAQLAPRS
jgi:hypothetical protein